MQQTRTTFRKTSMAFYSRITGTIVGLAFVFALVLSYAPTVMVMTGSGKVSAETTCTPENPRQGDHCAGCSPEDTSQTDSSCYVLPPQTITNDCPQGRCIFDTYLQPAINLASACVGLAVAISIIMAGIRYTTSADNPQKVSEAKQRLVTAVFVLVGYFTFYALLNYLIPGGLV